MTSPDSVPSGLAPSVSGAPVVVSPDTDVPETAVVGGGRPDSLPLVGSMQPTRLGLGDPKSAVPPQRLVCKVTDRAVDEDSMSSVSVNSLIQFFSNAFTV